MSEYALEVNNLHKSFKLPTEKAGKLKTAVVNLAKGIRGYKEQKVLKGISFKVKKGEFFGIVGRNGSGKSTLLKIISQIYEPTKGSVKSEGKLVPFIELGVGFNPELTGRENIYLNGALFGFSNQEIGLLYDEIVDFAELGEFMDQKLKNYSSGMQVRLAFSLAIRSSADILVLDEILAVGDEAFQRKCYAYFAEAKRHKKTVILVTHSMDIVQQFCTRAVIIEDGLITEKGSPARVAQRYREINSAIKTDEDPKDNTKSGSVSIVKKFRNTGAKLIFDIKLTSKEALEDPVLTVVINKDSGEFVYRWTSDENSTKPLVIDQSTPINLSLEIENIFPNGAFDMQIGLKKRDRSAEYAMFNRAIVFDIDNRGKNPYDLYWKPHTKFTLK